MQKKPELFDEYQRYLEGGNHKVFCQNIGDMYDQLIDMFQDYVAVISEDGWKNGYTCGYADAMKGVHEK